MSGPGSSWADWWSWKTSLLPSFHCQPTAPYLPVREDCELWPPCPHLSQEKGGMRRRRAYVLPLNTLWGSHTLCPCSHSLDLINLVTHPELVVRKDLGKVDFMSAKNRGYFHWKRNREQMWKDHSYLFCTYTGWSKFEIKFFSFTKETSQKFFMFIFLLGEMCIKIIDYGATY